MYLRAPGQARPASASQLVHVLRKIFADTGVPTVLRTDGGPQFTSSCVRRFLTRWGVDHRVSSPHNPQANGHAEAAVKLVMTTTRDGNLDDDTFARAEEYTMCRWPVASSGIVRTSITFNCPHSLPCIRRRVAESSS